MPRVLPRDPTKEQFWRSTLAKWVKSGLNIRDFCSRHRLAETAFYFWRREIAARDREPDRPAVAPKSRTTSRPKPRRTSAPSPRPTFVPVRVVPDRPLELVLRTGHLVRIPPGYDAAHVRAVVTALEAGAC